MRHIFLLILCLTFAATAFAQKTDPSTSAVIASDVPIEEAFLAKDDGNGKAGDAVSSFFTTDVPIYCVVRLNSTKSMIVKMNFVAVNVTGVKSDSKVVSSSFTTKDGQNRVNFTGKPYDKWSVGKYRVDIFIDGRLVKDIAFDIRPASGNVEGSTFFQTKTALKPRTAARPKKN